MVIEHILIVDDEPLIRGFLVELLERKKYRVEAAENGKQALLLLKKNAYDLVITDLKIPDINSTTLGSGAKNIRGQVFLCSSFFD